MGHHEMAESLEDNAMNNIFITGLWRSGTSLLLRLFDSHPQIFAMPIETGIVGVLEKDPEYLDKLKNCQSSYQLLSLISSNPVFRFQDIIRGAISGLSFSRTKDHYPFDFDFELFATSFFEVLRDHSSLNKIVYGYYESIQKAWISQKGADEKSTFAIQRAHRIEKYPGEDSVRFLMQNVDSMVVFELIRDPVFQIESALRNDPGLTLAQAVVSWAYSYDVVKQRSRAYPEMYKAIRYEDLVEDTSSTMRQLVDLVGIEWNEVLTKPTFSSHNWKPNSDINTNSGIRRRYKTNLSTQQLKYIQNSLHHHRSELSYPTISDIITIN
ncbi:hypothetical protein A3850_007250 [Lewinella sp. 4G2]|nr:hypothetical protein A3850_007250 [Lewinella sp. 4G2]